MDIINVKVTTNLDGVITHRFTRMCCKPVVGEWIDLPTEGSSALSNLKIVGIKHCLDHNNNPYLEIEVGTH